jgi:aminoglycoside phosphotransferase (APT) family kinase protein
VTTPWRREPAEFVKGLGAWASAKVGPDASVTDVGAPENGMANETVLFSVDGERYVARLGPLPTSPYPTFPSYDLEHQRRCMELVRAHSEVPVPQVVHIEMDPEWLGAPFLVLQRVDGLVPSDSPPYVFTGWLFEATPDQRQRLEDSSVRTLVHLHRITPEIADLSFLVGPDIGATAIEQQLDYQRKYYEWAREDLVVPIIEEAFEVLTATRPTPSRTTLNWGDSRIGNILYRDFEPAAVLDWEMATLGPPETDLGWMTFFHSFFQFMATSHGLPGISDFLDRDRAVATYERLAGHALDGLGWYEAFAALRFAIISIRTSLRSIAFGQVDKPDDPDGFIMYLPLFRRLLKEV